MIGRLSAIAIACLVLNACASGPNAATAISLSREQLSWIEEGGENRTKADVLLTLGQPSGRGAAYFPTSEQEHDLWFYQDLTANLRGLNSGAGRMDQQILLVFFLGEDVAGYMWFDGSAPISGGSGPAPEEFRR